MQRRKANAGSRNLSEGSSGRYMMRNDVKKKKKKFVWHIKTLGETNIFKQDNDMICVLGTEHLERMDWKGNTQKEKKK